MLNLTPPNYKYCPLCGSELSIRHEEHTQRKFCQKDNWTYYPRVATSCIGVIVRDSQVLMVKRNRDPYRGTWMFPSGFTEYGEHPEEAVIREILEETGLKTIKVELKGIMQAIDDYREPGHFLFVYKVEVEDGEIKTDEEENQAIDWFDISNPPEIGWITNKEIMKDLQRNKF